MNTLHCIWKQVALRHARARARDLAATLPSLHVRVAFGLIALATLIPLSMLCLGTGGALGALWILPAVLLVQELPRALLARAHGRSSHVSQKGALPLAFSTGLRAELHRTIAWAAIGLREPFLAHEALQSLPPERLDVHLVAAYLSCCNRVEEAVELLRQARSAGDRSPETTKLLLDLLYGLRDLGAARDLARTERQSFSDEEWSTLQAALGPEPTSLAS